MTYDFSIDGLPFSRGLSYISVTRDGEALKIHKQMRTYAPGADKNHAMGLCTTAYGNFVPSEVTFEVGLLTCACANGGQVEFTFDGADILRVRTLNASFVCEDSDLFCVRYFGESGEWTEYSIAETSGADIPPDYQYRPFEECVKENREDFEKWYSLYAPVEPRYEKMKKRCVYMIWICRIGARGKLKEPAILYSKPTEQSCFSWHQVYHAIAMRDAQAACDTLMNMFSSLSKDGELPDLLDDRYVNITATKPPIHGFGYLFLAKRLKFTVPQLEKMYAGLSKLHAFWTTRRDTDGDGVPQYNHGCESGFDFSAAFIKGVPVETPDIITYIILLAEALSDISRLLGNNDEADKWREKRDSLLKKLVERFRKDGKFIAKLSGLHEIVEFEELLAYIPAMLGDGLPREILDKTVADLSDEATYLSPFGLRSEPKNAAGGWIFGFSQVLLLPALYEAGYTEFAEKLMRAYVDWGARNDPQFMIMEPAEGAAPQSLSGFSELSALSAAEWLDLTAVLREIEDTKLQDK